MSLRNSKEYKALTSYLATAYAEGFEEATPKQVLASWQYLHDTKLAYQLQGSFGRMASELIERGLILS